MSSFPGTFWVTVYYLFKVFPPSPCSFAQSSSTCEGFVLHIPMAQRVKKKTIGIEKIVQSRCARTGWNMMGALLSLSFRINSSVLQHPVACIYTTRNNDDSWRFFALLLFNLILQATPWTNFVRCQCGSNIHYSNVIDYSILLLLLLV